MTLTCDMRRDPTVTLRDTKPRDGRELHSALQTTVYKNGKTLFIMQFLQTKLYLYTPKKQHILCTPEKTRQRQRTNEHVATTKTEMNTVAMKTKNTTRSTATTATANTTTKSKSTTTQQRRRRRQRRHNNDDDDDDNDDDDNNDDDDDNDDDNDVEDDDIEEDEEEEGGGRRGGGSCI